ncbi:MAG TPA: Crp/Fnr family transcriptional regulator [Thiobacillaceae bacterium]|nr:Crp/Fnr family transcriptional regulator [Thiobacillaceae bacterium]
MRERIGEDRQGALGRLPLFRVLSTEETQYLASQVREVRLGRGEILFNKGDTPHGFYVLVEGCVQLAFTSEQGTERVLEVIKPGESFGEALLFLDKPYPVSAQATQDCMLLDVPGHTILNLLEKDSQLARKMLAGISMRLHELIRKLEACSMRSSTQRVACMLQHRAPDKSLNQYEVELPAAKQTVASQLNLTPETFSRALHALSEAGLIEVSGRVIKVLDADGLRRVEI